jgi:hypothetical protein
MWTLHSAIDHGPAMVLASISLPLLGCRLLTTLPLGKSCRVLVLRGPACWASIGCAGRLLTTFPLGKSRRLLVLRGPACWASISCAGRLVLAAILLGMVGGSNVPSVPP